MASAVLLHPHPDMGGNQYNNVVTALHDELGEAGITPHRFDFASSDLQIARAQAIAAISGAAPPVYLVGYSFGGAVAATIGDPSIAAWCLIAPALTVFAPTIGPDPRPKYVLAGQHDSWFGPDMLRAATDGWAAVTRAVLPAADHFFGGAGACGAAALVAQYLQGIDAAR